MKKIIAFLTAFITVASLSSPVFATNKVIATEQGATLVGEFTDNISIDFDNEYFFQQDMMNPGDVWESHITLKNDSDKSMQVSLYEIKSVLDDTMLFDTLKLQIYLDNSLVYSGNYNGTPVRVFDWVDLPAHSSKDLKVITEFPGECKNEYQGKTFEANWVFEARCAESVTEETTDEEVQTGDNSNARRYAVVFLIAASGLAGCLVFKKKKDKEDGKDENK